MTDYIPLLNSPDLREHLRQTDKHLSPLQKAAAVYFTDALPLSEKHALYRELIAEHPELSEQLNLDALIAQDELLCASLSEPIAEERWCVTSKESYCECRTLAAALQSAEGRRSDIYCVATGVRLITNGRGEITRIFRDDDASPPDDTVAALKQALCAMDLYHDEKLPDLFVPGDFLSLWDYEYDCHEFNYDLPIMLLEEIGEDGEALVLSMPEDFPPECDKLPAYLLRRQSEDSRQPTESLQLAARWLRGEIGKGTFLCAYPLQVQRDCQHEDYLKKLLQEPEKS